MGTVLENGLVLDERIAVGGMAEVYRARQRGIGGFEKTVAVKTILPAYASIEEFRTMFVAETNLSARLQHPNIVQVYANGLQNGVLYLVMEFVEGRSLREIGRALGGQPFPIHLACLVVAEVAKGLAYAHSFEGGGGTGVIHRDVSPQNIMVSKDGHVKLVDFGIAKAMAANGVTTPGELKGKVAYMSPEQAGGEPLDGRTDVFSLGSVLYELLTGRLLFAGDNALQTLNRILTYVPDAPSSVRVEIPYELDVIVARTLHKDRSERYASAAELERDLVVFLNRNHPGLVEADLAAFVRSAPAAKVPVGEYLLARPESAAGPTLVLRDAEPPERPVATIALGVAAMLMSATAIVGLLAHPSPPPVVVSPTLEAAPAAPSIALRSVLRAKIDFDQAVVEGIAIPVEGPNGTAAIFTDQDLPMISTDAIENASGALFESDSGETVATVLGGRRESRDVVVLTLAPGSEATPLRLRADPIGEEPLWVVAEQPLAAKLVIANAATAVAELAAPTESVAVGSPVLDANGACVGVVIGANPPRVTIRPLPADAVMPPR